MSNEPKRLKRREIPQLPRTGVSLSSMPAWLVSLLLHVGLIVALAVFWTNVPKGTGEEPGRPIGVAVVYEGQESYELVEGSEGAGNAAEAPSAESTLPSDTAEALAGAADAALADLLPGSTDAGAAAASAAGGLGLGEGGTGISGNRDVAKAKTQVFGIEGEGHRFVYVFDRSASMNGYSGAPFSAAKREMIESISSLGEAHEFQVIFYNEYPTAFGSNSPQGPQILRGTDRDKRDALRFVKGVVADGSTQHIDALRMGLGMGPDVLFFLTDADVPAPSSRELESVVDRAATAGATIHTIQFGTRGAPAGGGWIESLAKSTGGQFRYVNVSAL